jgi:Zn-dependent M28 family amino/carboxypeptidase
MNTTNTKLRKFTVLLSMLILGFISSYTVIAASKTDEAKLQEAVEVDDIMEHLKALQKIADRSGGNRAIKPIEYTGPNGDKETRKYIMSVLKKAGLRPREEAFTFNHFHEATPTILELKSPLPSSVTEDGSGNYKNGDPGDESAQYAIVQDSGNGDLNSGNGDPIAPLQAVDGIVIPPASGTNPSQSTSGCEPANFSNFVAGNIALIQRGLCTFALKVDNAIAAGAKGVILFNEGNNPDRINLAGGTLQKGTAVSIPVIITNFFVGKELYEKLAGTDQVIARMKTDAEYLPTKTANIFAETRGRPDHVVMIGAHLDSVEDGPGINDNGSGVATLLEIAKGIQKLKIKPFNQVRFAFWGAEEAGQEGSTNYLDKLALADETNGINEVGKIALYLNADMLGSPNYVPSVYSSALRPPFTLPAPPPVPNSIDIENVLVDYFNGIGSPPKLLPYDIRSDYSAFLQYEKPFAAITSGFDGKKSADEAVLFGGVAGAVYDACYHKACDTIQNVSKKSLKLMSGALIHTLMEFASREVIFP